MSDSKNDDEDYGPGTLACHEVYHMSAVLMSSVQYQLCQHGSIKANPEWLALAEQARQNLGALFDNIGKEHIPTAFRARAVNYYQNDRFEARECDHCHRLYQGPAVYCSLACAEADASSDDG